MCTAERAQRGSAEPPSHQPATCLEARLDRRFTWGLAKPCRVLLVGPLPHPPLMGGVETGVELLMHTRLAEQTGMRLFNTGRAQDSSRSALEKISFQVGACWRFVRAMRETRPAIVHVKTSSGINFYQNACYVLLARLTGRKVVLQLHSGGFPAFYEGSSRPARAIIRSSLRLPHRLIALSAHWVEYFGSICGAKEIGIASNATEMGRYLEASADRSRFGIPEARFALLFMGTRSAELDVAKGILELIPAIADLRRTHPETMLVIAGHTWHRRELEGALGPEGDAWVCTGVVGVENKPALYASVDAFVLPSHYENMPNTLIEAMAAGLPSIATAVGAIPEMIEHGRSGLIVDVRDAAGLAKRLKQLLEDSHLRTRLGAAAREAACSRYDMPVLERALETEYAAICGTLW